MSSRAREVVEGAEKPERCWRTEPETVGAGSRACRSSGPRACCVPFSLKLYKMVPVQGEMGEVKGENEGLLTFLEGA